MEIYFCFGTIVAYGHILFLILVVIDVLLFSGPESFFPLRFFFFWPTGVGCFDAIQFCIGATVAYCKAGA